MLAGHPLLLALGSNFSNGGYKLLRISDLHLTVISNNRI